MIPRTPSRITFLALVILISGLVYLALGRLQVPTEPSSAAPSLQGYPPPASSTPPPATATPDAEGYLPPPAGLPWDQLGLSQGPNAELLLPLQAALTAGDASWPAARIADGRGGLLLAAPSAIDAEGGIDLASAGAEALLDAYFAAGAQPRIQGYFGSPQGGLVCLDLLIYRLDGPRPHPTAAPSNGPAYGPAPPSSIDAEAAIWRFCNAGGGEWLWQRWLYGDYEALATWRNAAEPPPGATYHLLRP
ncbi:MAG: hypothetical protein H6648_02310 [Caldilineae bacterium]|nr:hypothetical protein [Chloroflexota bacterium]MCB9175965.1 hypothetical protein [Caldilineae bacterium]